MRTLSLSYNATTGTYVVVDNPDFWRQSAPRRESFNVEGLANDIAETLGKNPGKKVKINVDKVVPGEIEGDLNRRLGGRYKLRFERVQLVAPVYRGS